MTTVDFVVLDPADPDPELLAGWHATRLAAAEVDTPTDPPPTLAVIRGELLPDVLGQRVTWVARDGARVLGGIRLALAEPASNPHTCDVAPVVHPAQRRHGLGRRLVEHAAAHARADGRTVVTGETECAAGAAFAAAMGAERVQDVLHSVLQVADAPEPVPVADGFELLRWTDRAPQELAAQVAVVKESMNDAPVGGLDVRPWRWDAARVRDQEARMAARGVRMLVVAARHAASGELAGLTELGVWPDAGLRGDQLDTVVVPAHRGHGLGLALKLDMLAWLRARHPQVTQVETWNAADNEPMLAVNRAIGFRPHRLEHEWQRAL